MFRKYLFLKLLFISIVHSVFPSLPKEISPPRSEPSRLETSRLNKCCCFKNKNNKQQTTQGVVGEDLVEKLKEVGVSDKATLEIMAKYTQKIIQNQLNYLPYRQAKNPAGLLVQAIRGDWSAPKEYLSLKAYEQKQAQEQKQALEEQKRKVAKEAKQKEIRQKLLAIEKKLSLPEKHALQQEAERKVRQRLGKSWPKEKPIPQTFLKSEFFSLLAEKYLNKNPLA